MGNKQDKYPLPHPKNYKDWLIFPNTAFSNIKFYDCSVAVDGVCTHPDTIEECIEECANNENCIYGIYIDHPQKICLPTSHIHRNLNMGLDMKSIKNIKDIPNNYSVNTFINNKYFPDKNANALHYDDICHLMNIETQTQLYTTDEEIFKDSLTVDKVHFDQYRYTDLRLISINTFLRSLNRFVQIKYGDGFFLNIKNTNFVLRRDTYGNMIWVLRADLLLEEYDELRIMPIEKNRKIGDSIAYGDKFYITYGNTSVLCVTNKGFLIAINDAYESLVIDKYNPTFTFISSMDAYYCDGNKCKSVPISNLEPGVLQSKYKGNEVYINENCGNICRKSNIQIYNIFIIYAIVMIIVIAIIFIYYFYRKNSSQYFSSEFPVRISPLL